jgi:hypothetical protein
VIGFKNSTVYIEEESFGLYHAAVTPG